MLPLKDCPCEKNISFLIRFFFKIFYQAKNQWEARWQGERPGRMMPSRSCFHFKDCPGETKYVTLRICHVRTPKNENKTCVSPSLLPTHLKTVSNQPTKDGIRGLRSRAHFKWDETGQHFPNWWYQEKTTFFWFIIGSLLSLRRGITLSRSSSPKMGPLTLVQTLLNAVNAFKSQQTF